ncbi:MAG: hypothetical protein Q8941_12175 [Bacteroidota bacterium]|nr:hypothetical protein [Bacteroidota bacterium]
MRYFSGRIILIAVVFSSCRYGAKDESAKKEKTNPKIRNGIVVTSKNINVEEAYLAFDDSTRIPEDNKVKVNQKVWLQLVTSGWKLKDSTAFLSGRETVETDDGIMLLDNKDLFKDFDNGLSGGSSQTIGISIMITELRKQHDYFKVSFKIKDEIEPRNAVEGYYKLRPY